MIQFIIGVKDGPRTRGETLDLDPLSPEDMARVDEAILEIRGELERIARRESARRGG